VSGVRQRHTNSKGTAVKKSNQNLPVDATTAGFPEQVSVVMAEIAENMQEGLLALVEGSTENATLVTDLLVGLRERGLDVTRPMLVGLDGAKALRKAVVDVLDHPVIQRCQLHKVRNVKDHLPQ
jgi:transposase-like protein